eukprot:Colp12_sorted_trinity150504_noHs@19119
MDETVKFAKQGYLNKKGPQLLHGWKRRWFVLSDSPSSLFFAKLVYYVDSTESEAKGVITLDALEGSHLVEQGGGKFLIKHATRDYVLEAEDETDAQKWISAIRTAIGATKAKHETKKDQNPIAPASDATPIKPVNWVSALPTMDKFDKAGFLVKEGGKRKNLTRRYFVLNDQRRTHKALYMNKLCYYKDENANEPLGVISMYEVTMVEKCNVPAFQFDIVTPKRTYKVKADTLDEMEGWISALQFVMEEISKLKETKMPTTEPELLAVGDSDEDSD